MLSNHGEVQVEFVHQPAHVRQAVSTWIPPNLQNKNALQHNLFDVPKDLKDPASQAAQNFSQRGSAPPKGFYIVPEACVSIVLYTRAM